MEIPIFARKGALCVNDVAEELGVSRAKWYRIVNEVA